ncbi:MAG: glycine cleavage system protein GcvH [Methylophilaceae bacterium]|jgi:glycine cleavage system H protein
MMNLPPTLHYTAEHLWVQETDDSNWLAGITDYAQDLLGDIVYLEPPKVEVSLLKDAACGVVESVKTGSDLHAPMNGVVTEINEALVDMPEDINDNPYQAWIFKFKPTESADIKQLLSAEAYQALID